MPASPPSPASFRPAHVAALLLGCLAGAGALHAQTQETGLMNRIEHPDRTLKYEDADHKFDAPAAFGSKQAAVKPFLFSHPADLKSGDGVFQTHNFNAKAFRTAEFATKAAPIKEYDKSGKVFAVRAVAVNEDRAAGKTMETHEYMYAEKPFLGRGKRQDTIDEVHDAKQMTVDQVRELLNKPK